MKWSRHFEVISEPAMKLAERLQDFGPAKVFIVGLVTTFHAVLADLFGGMLVLLVVFAFFDTMYGGAVAKARNPPTYSMLEAQKGFHSKIIGILLACGVRAFEWWFAQQEIFGNFDTQGALATAIAALLFAADLDSINQHRIRFGRGPVPLLGTAIEWIRRTAERLGAQPTEREFRRRKEDRE